MMNGMDGTGWSMGRFGPLEVAPVVIAIAALVKLGSRGPVFYRQVRLGLDGRSFTMYKFRTMVVDAEADSGPVFATADDRRTTRGGVWLRRLSLDELPQLLNVLKGEMSLVGPRPEMPWLVGEYEPWQRKRFAVPQGITGWWQVSGRSDKPMHLHTEDDLYYVQNYSLLLDLLILWKTIGVVLRGQGAY